MQAIDHIEIRYRRSDTVGAWTNFTLEKGQSGLQIPAVERGQTYQIEARAVGTNGEPSVWVQQTHTVADATSVPIAPTGLTALSVADGVHLAWAVSGTQRADVEYDVERTGDIAGAPDTSSWININNVKATAYTDGITDGVVRWYRVRAVDFPGNASAYSNDISSQNKSVQDGADKTLDQPIVRAGIGNNLIPNGNFLLGNLLGWETNSASFSAGMLMNTDTSGCTSATFYTTPGQNYRFTFIGKVNGAGTQNSVLRVNYASTYSENIPATTFNNLQSGTVLTSTIATYIYDWTAPAGAKCCSLAMYELGSAQLLFTDVSAQDYGAAGEWPIGGGQGQAGTIVNQGDLATINQTDTVNIVAGAVNASIAYTSSMSQGCPASTTTALATVTLPTNGGYVKIRCIMMLNGQSPTNYAAPNIDIRKGGIGGTSLVGFSTVFAPLQPIIAGMAACSMLEALDTTPSGSQQYTATITTNSVAAVCPYVVLVAENAKV